MKDDQLDASVALLSNLLKGGNSHATFADAVKDLPLDAAGKKVQNVPYTIWQLVEHIRIAQWDLLEFSRNAEHKSPKWPAGYWVVQRAPKDESEWQQALQRIEKERNEFVALLENNKEKLFEPFTYGNGQTLFKEALVLADHNAYHIGEMIIIRRFLGVWNK